MNFFANTAQAEEVVALVREGGGRAVALQADVGDKGQVACMFEKLAAELGPPTILVNNAGVLARGDLADFDFTRMEGMRRVNVDGLVHVTRGAVPHMQQAGWGRIVNLTSIAALGTSMAGTTFYAATKAAVITLTRRFALELGPQGITVNAVAPGFILTDMVAAGANVEAIAERAMVRRVGTPEDVANAVAFLVSEASSFITAQVLTVDGGRTDYIAHP